MKGWKTVTYVAGLVLSVIAIPQVQELISAHPAYAAVINGGVVLLLRWLTTTPIGQDK